jgi:hypothetical protein
LGFGERHFHGRKYYTGVTLNSDWVEEGYSYLWN